MPELARFLGIVIKMYYNEHNPPHFHVEYGEYRASVNISNLKIDGKLPKKVSKRVVEWAESKQPELINNWNRSQRGESLIKIGG